MRIGSPVGWEELAAEARLLCGSPVCEREENRVESSRIDSGCLPAGVEVARLFLRGDEASVEVRATAACGPQAVQRPPQAVEYFPSALIRSEPVDDLVPCRVVNSFRQIPAVRERRDRHNTMIVLC